MYISVNLSEILPGAVTVSHSETDSLCAFRESDYIIQSVYDANAQFSATDRVCGLLAAASVPQLRSCVNFLHRFIFTE